MLDIKKEREKRNLTQEEFADLLGVSRKTIANYEGGGNIPDTKGKIFSKILSNNTHVTRINRNIEIPNFQNLEELGNYVADNLELIRVQSQLFDLTIKDTNNQHLISKLIENGVNFKKS